MNKIKISVTNRSIIESMFFNNRSAVISIITPGDKPPNISIMENWLILPFHDANPEIDKDDNLLYFNDVHCDKIYKFITTLPKHVENLYIHCDAGISRSPAVAIAISDFMRYHNYKFETRVNCSTYPSYNRFVCNVLLDYLMVMESND